MTIRRFSTGQLLPRREKTEKNESFKIQTLDFICTRKDTEEKWRQCETSPLNYESITAKDPFDIEEKKGIKEELILLIISLVGSVMVC